MKNKPVLFSLFAVCIAFVGCGSPSADLIPVTGIVKIDGEPAANIAVQFVPNTKDQSVVAPMSQGITDAQGRFTLKTSKNEDGAVAGKHLVTLVDLDAERPAQGEEPTQELRLDPSYGANGIEVEVVKGKEIEINATGPQ